MPPCATAAHPMSAGASYPAGRLTSPRSRDPPEGAQHVEPGRGRPPDLKPLAAPAAGAKVTI
eukprot:scaffold16060_cov107-Isochrysis_galbana.AAC.2